MAKTPSTSQRSIEGPGDSVGLTTGPATEPRSPMIDERPRINFRFWIAALAAGLLIWAAIITLLL